MIQLYGLRMSNYYSLTKALLIEKGVEFEEVKAPPTQDEDNLTRSPMGNWRVGPISWRVTCAARG